MGLLSLITAPVTAPVAGLRWIAATVQQEAEREFYDPDKIRRELVEIEQQVERGEITRSAGDEIAGQLLERLMEAQQREATAGLPPERSK